MKYIAYCRKSQEEKNRQVLSIPAQITALKEFAKREHLEIVEWVEEEKTAKVPGREKFGEMLKKIEKGVASGIVAWHPDRIARNSIDGGKVIYLLDLGELVDIKFPNYWFENTPQGKFMLSIAFSQSKYYVDNLSENVKRGMGYKIKMGVWPMLAPAGYVNVNNKGNKSVEIEKDTARVLQKAFKLFAEGGKSFTEIARFLHKFNIPNDPTKGGKRYKADTVRRILSNKFYLGIMKYDGEYYPGTHKLFITKKIFDEVQKNIDKIDRPRLKGHNFAFSGLARCGECNAAITSEQHIKKYKRGDSQTFIYYRCTKKLGPCSQQHYSPETDIEEQVREIIGKCGIHKSYEPHILKWMDEEAAKDQIGADDEIKGLEREEFLLDEKLNRLLDTYLDQVIDADTYKLKKNQLFEEKLNLKEQIDVISKSGSSWLEPMKEWLGSALSCAKIARAKNTCHDLSIMAKTVGSNYFLLNRHLEVKLDLAFAAFQSEGDIWSTSAHGGLKTCHVNVYRKIRTRFQSQR